MKLAIVRQRFDASGSAERFVARSLPALERAGFEATLIAREAEGWGARRMLRVAPFHLGRLWEERSFAHAARQAWLREGFDLVQSHEPIPGCHVYRPEGEVAAHKETFEHPRLRAVLCQSNRMRDEIRRAFRVAPEKLHVVYNGVDLARFHPKERERLRGAARGDLGCRPRDTVLLLPGAASSVAVDAFAAANNDALWLVAVGAGASGQKESRRMRFVDARTDLRPLYAAADCLLLPHSREPFPDSVLEALAMGLPAIVGSASGAAEAIEPGVNGWLWEANDAASLARLLSVADAAVRSGGMEAAARASAERFGADATARQLVALYAGFASAPAES